MKSMLNLFRRKPKSVDSNARAPLQDDALLELLARLNALAVSGKTPIPVIGKDGVVPNRSASVHQMEASMDNVARGLHRLAGQAARGAAQLDPNALVRILDRMQNLGDATLRQIEGRIGVTVSRDDRKELQDLRDAVRDWLVARDDEREKAQQAGDELSVHANELREKFLAESRRLATAAQMAARAAAILKAGARVTSPEAAAFAGSLRTFLRVSPVSTGQ
jgi:hypothetical protein